MVLLASFIQAAFSSGSCLNKFIYKTFGRAGRMEVECRTNYLFSYFIARMTLYAKFSSD